MLLQEDLPFSMLLPVSSQTWWCPMKVRCGQVALVRRGSVSFIDPGSSKLCSVR